MLGGMGWMHGLRAKKATGGGGGGDVSCTTDFTEYVGYPGTTMESTLQTISGINTTITLRIDIIYADEWTFEYIKNGTATSFNSGDTLTVVNGDTLKIKWYNNALYLYAQLEIINTSDSNASLGIIQFEAA